jgi:hypothetical protein
MDARLEAMLNLLLESERAGAIALQELSSQVDKEELRRFLLAAYEDHAANARDLETLIRDAGGNPSDRTGPFAEKVAALESLRDRLNLLSRGQAWVAQKIEAALVLAPDRGAIRDFLQTMANRHRHEVEWGRAEVIRLMGVDE